MQASVLVYAPVWPQTALNDAECGGKRDILGQTGFFGSQCLKSTGALLQPGKI